MKWDDVQTSITLSSRPFTAIHSTETISDVIKLKEWGWKDVAWAYYVRSAIVKSGEEIVTKDIFNRISEQLYNRRESYLESLSERSIRVFKGQLPGANISKIK